MKHCIAFFLILASLACPIAKAVSFEPLVYTTPVEGVVPTRQASFAPARVAGSVSVMLIGDSLSVGPFGEVMNRFFHQKLDASQYCIFASCGSSPENWLKDTKDFYTPCGYRQVTARESFKVDFENGRKPRPVRTPKLVTFLPRFRPQMVIVQMGTNWMDEIVSKGDYSGDSYKPIIRQFITEIRAKSAPNVQIIWVLPPDASKYSARVKDTVDRCILESARELRFKTINSRTFTNRYVRGVTGSDGVHLNTEAGGQWAIGVIKRLPRLSAGDSQNL
jgi:hypothetical protein